MFKTFISKLWPLLDKFSEKLISRKFLVFIFAKQITLLRTGAEFTPEQVELVTKLTRLMLFSQFFFAISNFMTGILQSYHRFILPALAAIFYNFGILLGVYLFASLFVCAVYSTHQHLLLLLLCL